MPALKTASPHCNWFDDEYEDDAYLRECSVRRLGVPDELDHPFDAGSGVHRVVELAGDPPSEHEALFTEIASQWLTPANDKSLAGRDVLAELGSLERVACIGSFRKAQSSAEVDHRRAFILGLVDGERTLGDIVVASSIAPPHVLETLADLVEEGVLTLR